MLDLPYGYLIEALIGMEHVKRVLELQGEKVARRGKKAIKMLMETSNRCKSSNWKKLQRNNVVGW